jgi:hypothetical protein
MKKQGSKPMERAAARQIKSGELVPVGGGIYRLREYVDDLDVYVKRRAVGSAKFRALVRSAGAKRSRVVRPG